jgi:SAM-dependent methyltransferase
MGKYDCNYKFNDLFLKCYNLFKKKLLNTIKNKKKILEIGCGNGTVINYIDNLGCDIVAIDTNKEILNKLKKKNFNSKLKLINKDANKYIFEKNKLKNKNKNKNKKYQLFDYIIILSTLHEINNINDKINYLYNWLDSLSNLLKKKGKLIIGDFYYSKNVTLDEFYNYQNFQLKLIKHADPIYKFISFDLLLKVIKNNKNFIIKDFIDVRAVEEIDKRFYYFILEKK